MKCHKPNTDQRAEFVLLVNGVERSEYSVPSSSITDQNTLECFVPVAEGDIVSVRGYFEGSVLDGCFDVLVDGSFVGDKRIEGLKTGEVRLMKRNVKFTRFFDAPRSQDFSTTSSPTEIVQGSLRVKNLSEQLEKLEGAELGVGSVAVVVSVNQKEDDIHSGQYADQKLGSWRHRENASRTSTGGIPPTNEIKMLCSLTRLTTEAQSRYRRHLEHTRPGNKPWATFIFYYRSGVVLEQTSHVILSDNSHVLEPGPLSDFLVGEYNVGKKRKNVDAGENPEDSSTHAEEGRFQSNLMKAATYRYGNDINLGEHNPLFVTPPPDEKRIKMSSDQKSVSGTNVDANELPVFDNNASDMNNNVVGLVNETLVPACGEVNAFEHQTASAQAVDEEFPVQTAALDKEKETLLIEGASRKVKNSLSSQPKHKCKQKQRATDSSEDPSTSLSRDEIISAIPPLGITIENMYKHFRNRNVPVAKMFQQIEQVAYRKAGVYFLRTLSTPHAQQTAKDGRMDNNHLPAEGDMVTGRENITDHVGASPHQPVFQHSLSLSAPPSFSQSAFSPPVSALPLSALTTPSQKHLLPSTPFGKELDSLRAKKATLGLELARKRHRNQQMLKQLEAERKRRENQERERIEAEKREIEELERMSQELDDEMQVLDSEAKGFDT